MKLGDLEIDIDDIVIASLRDSRDNLLVDLETIKETGEPVGFFSWDDAEIEKDEINKYVEAFNTVLFYYSGS